VNQYWIIALLFLLASVGLIGERYGENRVTVQCDKHDQAQQQVTITAEQGVIARQQQSESITNTTEGNYEKDVAIIDDQYALGVQQSNPTSNNLPRLPKTACVTRPVACPRTSKVYKLTFEKCDKVQAGFNNLYRDWQEQSQ
jgi:hypothetical protein